MALPHLFEQPAYDPTAALNRLIRYNFTPAELDALSHFVRQASNHELVEMNPYYLIEKLGLEEHIALSLIAAAAAEGLFQFNWKVACSSCRWTTQSAFSLADVSQEGYCPYCNLHFHTHLDDEISFTLSATNDLRPLDKITAEVTPTGHPPMSALRLINTMTFRDLLTTETLSEGQSLGVRQMAIFFSDLRGSTAMYNRLGDAVAYQRVREHFQAIFAAVSQHQGTAIKTIGDGVMGSFTTPAGAVQGIRAVLNALERVNLANGFTGQDRLILKVGLHVGPCIVVTLNKQLDYFGETVNIAARLSEQSKGHEIVVSEAVLADPAAQALLAELGPIEPLTTELRGLPTPQKLYRVVHTPYENPSA